MQPTIPKRRKRPELDLGPMGGSPAEVKDKIDTLVRAFAALLDTEIRLLPGDSGKTDCFSTIWLNMGDPEAYLVAEHELSHWLFESDSVLLKQFATAVCSKLLNKAGYKPGTDAALPFERRLSEIVAGFANILDDHRVAGLWGEIYAGGEQLLRERWDGIVKYDYPIEKGEKNILNFFILSNHGVDVPNAPKDFQDCKAAMKKAMNLVEGVDFVSCLGVTWRLIEDISDVLLANHPPPPSESGKKGKSGGKEGNKGGNRRRKGNQSQRRKEGQQQVKLLANLVPSKGTASGNQPMGPSGPGAGDVQEPTDDKAKYRQKKRQASAMAGIKRILRSDSKDSDESGMTPLQLAMHNGAQAMESRIESARAAMMTNKDDPKQAYAQIVLGYARVAGITKFDVHPTRPLPPPTEAGHTARRELEKFRMKKKNRKDYDGDFMPSSLLDALGTGELDRPLFEMKHRVPDFELLFLFDFSGSMFFGNALKLVETGLADSIYATQAIKSRAEIWGYSSGLYAFSEVGSIHGVQGLHTGGTMMVQALDAARLWARKDPRKRAILHFTDGIPTSLRARNSTGDPIKDLRNIMDEIRTGGAPVSTVAIRHSIISVEEAKRQYDDAFGEGRYGLVSQQSDINTALVVAVRDLARGHIKRAT